MEEFNIMEVFVLSLKKYAVTLVKMPKTIDLDNICCFISYFCLIFWFILFLQDFKYILTHQSTWESRILGIQAVKG